MNKIHPGVKYITSILIISSISYVVVKPLVYTDSSILIVDAVLVGILLTGLLVLLKIVIKYGKLSSLQTYQQITVYTSLSILFVICWIGISLGILYIAFSSEEFLLLLPSIPLRILVGILVYCTAIQWFTFVYKEKGEITEEYYGTDKDKNEEEHEFIQTDDEIDYKENILDRIAVKNGSKIDVIPVSEIIYLQAEGDYVMIHCVNGRYLKEQTMKSFENQLPANQFVRVHRSSIINIDFIAQIELYDKQSQLLKMQNGSHVRVSTNGYKVLKTALQLK